MVLALESFLCLSYGQTNEHIECNIGRNIHATCCVRLAISMQHSMQHRCTAMVSVSVSFDHNKYILKNERIKYFNN